jgi:hypothetical protein
MENKSCAHETSSTTYWNCLIRRAPYQPKVLLEACNVKGLELKLPFVGFDFVNGIDLQPQSSCVSKVNPSKTNAIRVALYCVRHDASLVCVERVQT